MKKTTALLGSLLITSNAYAGIMYTSFNDIASDPNSINVRIDDHLPNPGVNNSVIGSTAIDTFTKDGIGIIAEGELADGTSAALTSDFRITDSPLVWSFVDPTDPSQKATISSLGFLVGSLHSFDAATAFFYDINDVLIDSLDIFSGTQGASIAFDFDGAEVHKVEFSGADEWYIGSFNLDTSLTDITFNGSAATVTDIPEPHTIALLGIALMGIRLVSSRKSL